MQLEPKPRQLLSYNLEQREPHLSVGVYMEKVQLIKELTLLKEAQRAEREVIMLSEPMQCLLLNWAYM